MNDSKTTLNSNLIFFAQEKKTQQKNLSHHHLKRFFIVLILTSIFSSLSFSLFSQCNINGVPLASDTGEQLNQKLIIIK